MKSAYRLNKIDNVAMLTQDVSPGDEVAVIDKKDKGTKEIALAISDIPAGHKISLSDLKPGDIVYKYGAPIGAAYTPIKAGDHVHLHNMRGIRGRGDK